MAFLRPARRITAGAGIIAIVFTAINIGGSPPGRGSGDPNLVGGRSSCFSDSDIEAGTVDLPSDGSRRQRIIATFERTPTATERSQFERDYKARFLTSIPDTSYAMTVLVDPSLPDEGKGQFNEVLKALHEWTPRATCLGLPNPGNKDIVDGPIEIYIRFFRDTPVREQRAVLDRTGATGWETAPPYNNEWRVTIQGNRLPDLEAEPDVQWIEYVEIEPGDDMDEARRLIGLPGDYLNKGDGTVIAQWELCHPAIVGNVHPALVQRAETGIDLDVESMCDVAVPAAASNVTVSTTNKHATQVAGIVIGSGAESDTDGGLINQWRGVAPESRLVSYSLLDRPGLAEEYLSAVSKGASISTNSWGPRAGDYQFEEITAAYPFLASFYDTIASSKDGAGRPTGPGARLLIVTSAGNRGNYPEEESTRQYWRTIRTRNSAKNTLTVGNVATGEGSAQYQPAFDTGRGPTVDDRIKPDLVAPGAEVLLTIPDGRTGIHSTTYPPSAGDPFYQSSWGTSFSTPVVAGSAALVSSTFRKSCARNPSSAELRALLIHSAEDLVDASEDASTLFMEAQREDEARRIQDYVVTLPPQLYAIEDSGQFPQFPVSQSPAQQLLVGPDYVFGFGLVRPAVADTLVEGRHFVTNSLGSGYIDYPVVIESSTLEAGDTLRVTLVWDDPPYPLNARPDEVTGLLQNDLDLIVIDPNGNRYFPWKLDPDNPEEPATLPTRRRLNFVSSDHDLGDHRNTVEQVSIAVNPALLDRTWRIRVLGSTVRLPDQEFTLVSSVLQPPIACGTLPTVSNPEFKAVKSEFLFRILLLVALVILLLLLLWLAELIYQKYEPVAGRAAAIAKVIAAYFFLLIVTISLYYWLPTLRLLLS